MELESVSVRVRCPNCFKLYAVQAAEIHESKPQFACAKCQTRFWFPFPESLEQAELIGFPVAWLNESGSGPTAASESALPVEKTSVEVQPALAPKNAVKDTSRLFHCPRCEAPHSVGDEECPKCGVVFAKLDFIENGKSVAASPQLRRLWRDVVDHYSNLDQHHRFLAAAQREKNLTYAAHQYGRLLEVHSGDEMAIRMKTEIMALANAEVGTPSRRWRWSRMLPRVGTLILMCGGALIGTGFMIPGARNLIGLGAAVVFFTFAIDWFFQREQ